MSTNMEESSMENPTESKTDVTTIAEEGLLENPEIVKSSAVELSQEDKSTTEEITQDLNGETGEWNDENDEFNDKPEVHFAPGHTSISYVPEEEEDTISVISFLLEEFTGHFFARLPRILSMEAMLPVSMEDKFTQTFFKAMTKLSKRRFVEIINTHVDHEDPTLVFFCPSYELLSSFRNNENSVKT